VRMKRKGRLLLVLGIVFLVLAGGIAWSQVTERVSVDSAGVEGNNASTAPSNSSDGRYVAFESSATNLVAGGSNGLIQIFVHDRQTGTTTQVSVDSGGNEGDRPSNDPSISADGRYVAFESSATNLVAAGGDILQDIYVHDRLMAITTRVSVNTVGDEGDGFCLDPSISDNGRYVAFLSDATDLVPGGSDGSIHIFVHDRDADDDGIYDEPGEVSSTQVSVDLAGSEGNAGSGAPSISGDGRYVAFESSATNLVPGGSDGSIHIFVHDRDADGNGNYDEVGGISTVQVSVDSAGAEGDNNSNFPSISSDSRYVAFESLSTNLVVGDTLGFSDVFVHDRDADGNGAYDEPGAISTTRVSVDLDGVEGNGNSNAPSISADGKSVIFQSDADNLLGVGNDNNMAPDIFVDDLQPAAGGGGGSNSGGGGCFIATAADGSRMAGEVK
jgi:Tol biopolymer transport system component